LKARNLYLRPEEAEALEFSDLDLEHGAAVA